MIVCETFGRMPHPLEERDQDRRIGRREHCADQEADRRQGTSKTPRPRPRPTIAAVMITPGDRRAARARSRPAAGRRTESCRPPWKRMIDDAERQEQLRRRRVERHVDPAGERRARGSRRPRRAGASPGAGGCARSARRRGPAASISASVRMTSSVPHGVDSAHASRSAGATGQRLRNEPDRAPCCVPCSSSSCSETRPGAILDHAPHARGRALPHRDRAPDDGRRTGSGGPGGSRSSSSPTSSATSSCGSTLPTVRRHSANA